MSYDVRSDFVEQGPLTSEERQAVEDALEVLADDPRPAAYGCKNVRNEVYRILVPVGTDRVAIVYEVNDAARTIELTEIRRSRGFEGIIEALEDLLDFGPGR